MADTQQIASIQNARLLEKEGNIKQAAVMYQQLLNVSKNNLFMLTRLMVISRKLKLHNKEMAYISRIIKVHEQNYNRIKKVSKQVEALSEKLNRLLGHIDKKGKNLIASKEIVKLQKRQENLLKKLAEK